MPFTPPRTVEAQVAGKAHRCWGLSNINLTAPISVPMWRTWSNMGIAEVETLKSNAIHGTGLLREGQPIPGAFPLSLYDHHNCTSLDVRILTKQLLNSNFGRIDKYSSAIWHCQRPNFRCTCKPDLSKGCRGDVMWFDQAVWYMVNNLHVFFDHQTYPTLSAKFAAFIIWISGATPVAVKHQIIFHYIRDMMVEASLQFAADPQSKLLATYPQGAGVRQVERWIKPASFSAVNPLVPGSGSSSKRPRTSINCNVSPGPHSDQHQPATPRTAPRGPARGGRGGYNRRFRQAPHSAPQLRGPPRNSVNIRAPLPASNPNEAFVFTGPAYRNHVASRNTQQKALMEHHPVIVHDVTGTQSMPKAHSPSQSEVSSAAAKITPRFDRKSMKGRVLDWDSVGN